MTARTHRLAVFASIALAVTGAGCASHTYTRGNETCSRRTIDRLYFGTDTPGGAVSVSEWDRFLTEIVTPRFPSGLTIVDARGQWMGSTHEIVRERSYVVEIIHDGAESGSRSVSEIIDEYRRRFRQESVLHISTEATACF